MIADRVATLIENIENDSITVEIERPATGWQGIRFVIGS